jgi:hypothetical protein
MGEMREIKEMKKVGVEWDVEGGRMGGEAAVGSGGAIL